MGWPRPRPSDLEERVRAGLQACPCLDRALGDRIVKLLESPDTSLENRLVRGLYTYVNDREHETLNVALRIEQFLRLGEEKGIDFSIPLATFSGDLDWGLKSVIAELRAGLKAKEEFNDACISYLKPGKSPSPDFKIALDGHEQYAEVKNIEDANIFDIFVDKVEAAALVAPQFTAEYILSERYYFPDPHVRARELAQRMGKEIDRILQALVSRLVALPVTIERGSLALEFLERVVVRAGPRMALVGSPGTPLDMMECNARCCDKLSRGILARIVNQVTQAYWKLRDFRDAAPVLDHIYLDVDFGCPPFEEEIKEKVRAILDTWGISSRVRIHLM